MKYILTLFVYVSNCSFGQSNNLLAYKKNFEEQLKSWTITFDNFNLSDFKPKDTLHFDNNFKQDFSYYKNFLSTYQPLITYSPDKSKFIDIYSYQLNLEKKGEYYYANPDIDQTVFLCDQKKQYWNRIYFATTSSHWIDEVVWISETKFILVGSTKSTDNKNLALVLIGDTDSQTLEEYSNSSCFQITKGYESPKLKKIKIKGL